MIGYKDKSWCIRYTKGECVNKSCDYAFTSDDRVNAIKWWGDANFPICHADRMDNDCGYMKSE